MDDTALGMGTGSRFNALHNRRAICIEGRDAWASHVKKNNRSQRHVWRRTISRSL
jgi:hypothetical protein